MSAELIGFSLLLVGIFLLVAKAIRIRFRPAQSLFLPSSIIGGLLVLLIGPQVLGRAVAAVAGDDAPLSDGILTSEILEVWSALPELLISVVFATLFLGTSLPGTKQVWRLGGPQLALGVTMGAGQYVVGILLAVLVITPLFGLPPLVGALIEVGFEGGHGTAAGLAGTFEDLGFPEATDLALGLATVGIVSGVVLGIWLINWGVRRNHTFLLEEAAEASKDKQRGIYEKEERGPAGEMTTRPESIEPLSIHFAVVAIAILIGVVLLEGLQALEAATWGPATDVFLLEYVPLFPLAMIGGILLQSVINRLDRHELIDRQMIVRIQGFALDVLILTALATLSLQVIADNLVPFLLLAGAGVAWNVAVFMLLARRMIPQYWFERGIGDLGQSLGVTATGLLLMRIVDPETETPAYEAFGYKQLGFEPFLGGGLVTATSVPLIAQFGPWPVFAIMLAVLAVALAVGLLHFGRQRPGTTTPATARPPAGRGL